VATGLACRLDRWSPRLIALRCGAMACDIEPGLGGCIAGLWHKGQPVLRPAPRDFQLPRQAASYPLVPYSNRIANARMHWQGTVQLLRPNHPPEPHAIHGVGRHRPWLVMRQEQASAHLHYSHSPDADWPFAFCATQELHLEADALNLSMTLVNRAPCNVPAGLGWHPFFLKRPGMELHFAAQGRWEMGPDMLPTHRVASAGVDADCDTLVLDHCFEGWSGPAVLGDDRLRIAVTSDQTRLVVCTAPSRDFVAIEPVSHVNNAIEMLAGGASATALGLVVLTPGESIRASMTIRVLQPA
jgi:aldose 1-epimerase